MRGSFLYAKALGINMPNGTKDRILEVALAIFARDGYAGTNLKDIAETVGVVKSAFYRHYASKEEVWNAVIDRMEVYYTERFGSLENLPEVPRSCDEFFRLVMNMVNFTLHDEKIIMSRKLLLTEQFHDERVKKLATEHFINATKEIFKHIFEKMIESGLIKEEDPAMLAFVFTSPITILIHYCDREQEKEAEILRQIEEFVQYFIKLYGKN